MEGKKNWEKKIDLKLINYFHMVLQTHFIYLFFNIYKLNNFKIYKFVVNFHYIWFYFYLFILKPTLTFFFLIIYGNQT